MGNLYDENPQGTNGIIGGSILLALSLLSIVGRVWSKKTKGQSFRLNDYSIFVAWILSAAAVGLYIASVKYGLGEHLIVQVPLTNLETFIKLEAALSIIWVVACTFVKVSILDGYLQIFRGQWFIRGVWVTMVFSLVLCVAVLLEIFLICRPFPKYWDPTIAGTCGDWSQAFLVHQSLTFVSDVIIGLLPLFVLWKLQMATSKKISICLIFAVGTLICVISLLRIIEVANVSGNDVTYDWALLLDLIIFEPLLGIIVACLPFIQPVINKTLDSRIVRSSRRLLLRSKEGSYIQTDGSTPKRGSDYPMRKKAREFDDSIFDDTDHIGLVPQKSFVRIYGNSVQNPSVEGTKITVETDMNTRSDPARK